MSMSANDIGNPAYRPTDPREGKGGTIRGKAAIFHKKGDALVMVKVRFDWTVTPGGIEVVAFLLEPFPADADDLAYDLCESAVKALDVKFIAHLQIVR